MLPRCCRLRKHAAVRRTDASPPPASSRSLAGGGATFELPIDAVYQTVRIGSVDANPCTPSDPGKNRRMDTITLEDALRLLTLPRVLELVREMRGEVSAPLVFLTYYNPILAFGLKAFCATAVESGVDGVIVADLPPEESGPLRVEANSAKLDVIHLVAPTSTPDRMRKIARASSGFLYMVSLTGVTGARAELPAELSQHLRALRGITTKPICVGFGIGTPAQGVA